MKNLGIILLIIGVLLIVGILFYIHWGIGLFVIGLLCVGIGVTILDDD